MTNKIKIINTEFLFRLTLKKRVVRTYTFKLESNIAPTV